jgi:hypothetical protein
MIFDVRSNHNRIGFSRITCCAAQSDRLPHHRKPDLPIIVSGTSVFVKRFGLLKLLSSTETVSVVELVRLSFVVFAAKATPYDGSAPLAKHYTVARRAIIVSSSSYAATVMSGGAMHVTWSD